MFDSIDKVETQLDTVDELIKSIRRAKLLRELSIKAYEVAEGKTKPDSLNEIYRQLEHLASTQGVEEEKDPFVSDDLEQLVEHAVRTPGLRWRLGILNRSLGSLRKGDFGFVFARPETGKTTFLASEVSEFLKQVTGPIIWFNNEEQGEKVMLRVYQAYFGITLEELLSNTKHYKQVFQQETKGNFKLFDSSSIDKRTVEKIVKKWKPALVLFDQIDKIKGFDADREDLVLGAIYQWARELAKEFCPVIGICQADGTGENVRFLTMANVANAKTSKQAEADWILGIGAIHDTGWEYVRFLCLSKNKLIGDEDSDPKLRHLKEAVLIEPTIARYRDME